MRWALLFLVAASLDSGCRTQRQTPVEELAAQVGSRLGSQRSVVGAVEAHGNEITLLDGSLDLVLRVPQHRQGPWLHVHARATARGKPMADLDICLVGRDLADVADELIENALPPIISALRDVPVLRATHAWSDTADAIPGHSAYFGVYRATGYANPPSVEHLFDDGLFANPPPLPHDGRMHLLKLVAVSEGSTWKRTFEIDGASGTQDNKPLEGRSDIPTIVVAFAALDGNADPLDDKHARDDALRRLAAHPLWLPDPNGCPAKLLPANLETTWWDPLAARGGRLLHAIRGCERGAAQLCYAAAQEFADENPPSPVGQSLFLRACRLGSASGCTNAAAGRPAQDDCAFATYEASCERGKDPWGCTMLGIALVKDAKHHDIARARTILPRGCSADEDNPACRTAKQVLESLDEPQAPAAR